MKKVNHMDPCTHLSTYKTSYLSCVVEKYIYRRFTLVKILLWSGTVWFNFDLLLLRTWSNAQRRVSEAKGSVPAIIPSSAEHYICSQMDSHHASSSRSQRRSYPNRDDSPGREGATPSHVVLTEYWRTIIDADVDNLSQRASDSRRHRRHC